MFWSSRSTPHQRRQQDRHSTDALSCDIGVVQDLSTSGMRVACTCKPPVKVGQIQKIRIKSQGTDVVVTGKVIWVRRTRFRKYDAGVQFIAVKPAVEAALDQLARFGFIGINSESFTTAQAANASRASSSRQGSNPGAIRASIHLPDYYALLEIGPDASQSDIREAYRRLARRYHPDMNPDEQGQKKFIEISEAYEILKDSERRMAYDLRKAG